MRLEAVIYVVFEEDENQVVMEVEGETSDFPSEDEGNSSGEDSNSADESFDYEEHGTNNNATVQSETVEEETVTEHKWNLKNLGKSKRHFHELKRCFPTTFWFRTQNSKWQRQVRSSK